MTLDASRWKKYGPYVLEVGGWSLEARKKIAPRKPIIEDRMAIGRQAGEAIRVLYCIAGKASHAATVAIAAPVMSE